MDKLRNLNGILKSWNREVIGDFRIKKQEVASRIGCIDALEEIS